ASLASQYELIPLHRKLLGDYLTPVTAFELLGKDDHAFLLESVVGNEKIGRHSFIATSPSVVYQVSQGQACVRQTASGQEDRFETSDPLADLQRLLPKRKCY